MLISCTVKGHVQVVGVLDDDEYREQNRERKRFPDSDDGTGGINTSDALLGTLSGTPIVWDEYEEEEPLNPESVGRWVRSANGFVARKEF